MRIDILNFILKWETIIQFEPRSKEERWTIAILLAICIQLEQRKIVGEIEGDRNENCAFRDEIYRFNLEQGQFLEPITSKST